jgi:Pyruvate/2-oxoacid:ferredoxin oxidoreductase gamma subunit
MSVAIPIDRIVNRPDARAVDAEAVQRLVDSVAKVGLINPIRVRASGDKWEVIAGAHRLEAHKHLGLAEIEAIVVADDDLHAELAMIDENLCRAELSPSDRARQTARRKAIYLELHPETAEHVAGGVAKNSAADNLSAAPSFAAATAAVTGADERTVRRDAERGEKVIPEALDLVRGTKLDTGTYLDKLKMLTPNDQVSAVRRDLALLQRQQRDSLRPVSMKVAEIPLDDEAAKEKQVAALMAAWNKASAEAREEFLSRIETPVFDRSAA